MPAKSAYLIFNSKSGKGAASSLDEDAKKFCAELGIPLHLYPFDGSRKFEDMAEEAVRKALADGGVVIAAGGDGTIRGVAQVAHGTGVRFAAVACGTFNFFARTHRLPEDPTEALKLALTGEPRPVRLGAVNEHVFLINASLGLYAESVAEREQRFKLLGRSQLAAIISTILSFFSNKILLRVDIEKDGKASSIRTPMIFIGNNALQLRNLEMDVAECMRKDLLALVLMRPFTKLQIFRFIFRGLTKTLHAEDRLVSFCVDQFKIHTRKPLQRVALDGELLWTHSPLNIKALPETLNMVLPPKEIAAEEAAP